MEKKKAPDFRLPAADGKEVTLKSCSGSWVVLYFYPKDSTSGCTREAVDFTGQLPAFRKRNAMVIGISPDSPASHEKFAQKNDLKVTLLSDPEHDVLTEYDVWQKKKLYGKEYMGVVRTTLLIDPEGYIRSRWDKVNVNGHAEEVLKTLTELTRTL